mmetsp:Transcript_37117/g.85776  ORF Transcript_37117/g.85776 Transcript_37117/m.85776 type:complete len:278 (-) Transcript_37117:1129-1962(-)
MAKIACSGVAFSLAALPARAVLAAAAALRALLPRSFGGLQSFATVPSLAMASITPPSSPHSASTTDALASVTQTSAATSGSTAPPISPPKPSAPPPPPPAPTPAPSSSSFSVQLSSAVLKLAMCCSRSSNVPLSTSHFANHSASAATASSTRVVRYATRERSALTASSAARRRLRSDVLRSISSCRLVTTDAIARFSLASSVSFAVSTVAVFWLMAFNMRFRISLSAPSFSTIVIPLTCTVSFSLSTSSCSFSRSFFSCASRVSAASSFNRKPSSVF